MVPPMNRFLFVMAIDLKWDQQNPWSQGKVQGPKPDLPKPGIWVCTWGTYPHKLAELVRLVKYLDFCPDGFQPVSIIEQSIWDSNMENSIFQCSHIAHLDSFGVNNRTVMSESLDVFGRRSHFRKPPYKKMWP